MNRPVRSLRRAPRRAREAPPRDRGRARRRRRRSDALDVIPDVGEPRRPQREDFGRAAGDPTDRFQDLARGDRADLALVLGDDQVGCERGEQRLVDAVDREARGEALPQGAVDFPAGAARVDLGCGDHRQATHVRRKIALVGHPDQVLPESECTDDLGRAGQERDDARSRGHRLSLGTLPCEARQAAVSPSGGPNWATPTSPRRAARPAQPGATCWCA